MGDGMHVFVKFDNSTVPIKINSDSTVEEMRAEISKTRNLSNGEVRIVFAGKELYDYQRLRDMDIQSQTVVHAFRGKHLEPRTAMHSDRHIKTQACNSDESVAKRNIPTYFVLCRKVCSKVKPGKLRIRCTGCGDDKIVLSSEPQQWSDILELGRIQGTCHTQGCNGTQPQFYFKCRGHDSDKGHDCVVPLPLVRNNFLKVSCMTCLDDGSNPVLVYPCPSNHAMCMPCFESYCLHQLNSRQFIEHDSVGYTLSCPGTDSDCRAALITDVHHFSVMGPDHYERYKQFAAEECLLKMGGVLCPAPNCGTGIFVESEYGREDNHVECRECGHHFCLLCRGEYHGEETCTSPSTSFLEPGTSLTGGGILSQYAVNMSLSRYDSESAATIRETTKPCPQCGTPVEKSGGCMHMECPLARCHFSWCWMCCSEWTQECQDNHWFG